MIQRFGGQWTEKKLEALEDYLKAYLRIFTRNQRAAKFTRHYVDAFAGSGMRQAYEQKGERLDFDESEEAVMYMDGSVRKVLSLDQEFHHYWFVEKSARRAAELQRMVGHDFSGRAEKCHVEVGDANDFLLRWTPTLSAMDRAVVFLDPYGMDVSWETIVKLAETRKVDLWMLFPSSGVIRMLPREGEPEEAWSRRLTRLFGSDAWKETFYRQETTTDLFGEHAAVHREVSEASVADFLLRQMKHIFAGVAEPPLILRNSRNSPLFMLVFAAGNPKGAPTAMRIAHDIIQNK